MQFELMNRSVLAITVVPISVKSQNFSIVLEKLSELIGSSVWFFRQYWLKNRNTLLYNCDGQLMPANRLCNGQPFVEFRCKDRSVSR